MTQPNPTSSHGKDTAGVLILPPLLFALPVGLGWLMARVIPSPELPAVCNSIGLVLLVLALIPGPWALVVMLRAGVNPEPHVPTRSLVLGGPFRFTRNPIYLTYILFVAGLGMIAGNLWILLLLCPAIVIAHYGIVLREERYLSRRFGLEYTEYLQRVRRWL